MNMQAPIEDAAPVFVDTEMEQALIGLALVDAHAFADVAAVLNAEDFADPLHQRIWGAAASLRNLNRPVTPITIGAHLSADAGLEEVGGRSYLATLAKAAPFGGNHVEYGRILADLSVRRRLSAELEAANARLISQDATPIQCLTGVLEVAGIAADKEARRAGYLALPDALDEVMREAENASNGIRPPSVPTGLRGIDNVVGGLQAGNMVVVAGRPGSGKTVVLAEFALAAAIAGKPVILFELEMSRRDIIHRLICNIDYDTRGAAPPLSYNRMRNGRLWAGELERMDIAQRKLRDLPLKIFDSAGMTLTEIGAHAERFVDEAKDIGLIAMDYLQIVVPSDRYLGSKVAEVTETSNGTKRLAKKLGWPVAVGCQLSRAVEARPSKDRRPTLSDLRESGAIEQDADIVFGLHRPAYYVEQRRPINGRKDPGWIEWLSELDECRNDLELCVLKNRSGPTALVKTFVDIGAAAVRNAINDAGDNPGEGMLS